MYMKYKKIIFLIAIVFTPHLLLSEINKDDKNKEAKEALTTIEKKLFQDLCLIFSNTYKEFVEISALHFITRDDKEALELKLIKKVGTCFYKIIIELGGYSKTLFFLPVPVFEKGKRFSAVVAGVGCMYFAVNTLSNRQKTFEKDKTIHK